MAMDERIPYEDTQLVYAIEDLVRKIIDERDYGNDYRTIGRTTIARERLARLIYNRRIAKAGRVLGERLERAGG